MGDDNKQEEDKYENKQGGDDMNHKDEKKGIFSLKSKNAIAKERFN